MPQCVIALANRNASHDIFGHIRALLAHIFCDNICPHTETNYDSSSMRVVFQQIGYHQVEIFGTTITENTMGSQFDGFHCSNVIDGYTSVAFPLCMSNKGPNVDGFTRITNPRT